MMSKLEELNGFLQKTKIYLKPGESAPSGKAVYTGSGGGRYYVGDTEEMERWKRSFHVRGEAKISPKGTSNLESVTGMSVEELIDKILVRARDYSSREGAGQYIPQIKQVLNFLDFYVRLSNDPSKVSEIEVAKFSKELASHTEQYLKDVEGSAVPRKVYATEKITKKFKELRAALLYGDKSGQIVAIDQFVGIGHSIEPTIIPHVFGIDWSGVRVPFQGYITEILDYLASKEADMHKSFQEIRKARVYLQPGEKPPEGKAIQVGPEGGRYYESTAAIKQHPTNSLTEEEKQIWRNATAGKKYDPAAIRKIIEKNPSLTKHEINLPNYEHGGYISLPSVYLRFGRPPQEGKSSMNYAFNKREAGVSVYKAWYDSKTKKYVLEATDESEYGEIIETQGSFAIDAAKGKKKIYLVEGLTHLQSGYDGEDLLYPDTVKIIREVSTDDVVTQEDPNVTLSEKDLSDSETPRWYKRRVKPNTSEYKALESKYDALSDESASISHDRYEVEKEFVEAINSNISKEEQMKIGKRYGDILKRQSIIRDELGMLYRKLEEMKIDEEDHIQKARVYLGAGDIAPKGVTIQTGVHGGRFYDAPMRTSEHAWERAIERVSVVAIKSSLSKLNDASLPHSEWFLKIIGDGTICGEGAVIKTVLAPTMKPRGIMI